MDMPQFELAVKAAFGDSASASKIVGSQICVTIDEKCSLTEILSVTAERVEGDLLSVMVRISPVMLMFTWHKEKLGFAEVAKYERECGLELEITHSREQYYSVSFLVFDVSDKIWRAVGVCEPASNLLMLHDLSIAGEIVKRTGSKVPLDALIPKDGLLPPTFVNRKVLVELVP